VLTEQDGLHVMEERMPPGKAEVRHLHRNVRQLYFVSAGTGTVCFGDREEFLSPGDAVDVAPGQAHQLRNDSGEPLGGVEARICDEPKRVGPALRSRRVLASLPVSELSNDLFPQRGRKRLLARDHAGLPNRLANLVDVGIAAGAVGEVALKPLLLVGRQRVVEVVSDDLDHLLAAELGVHGASVVK
jgi:Cupin domain